MESYGRKRKSNYPAYKSRPSGNKPSIKIESGLRGFICTCNFREKDCVRESYNLLNEYADRDEEKVAAQPNDSPDAEIDEDSDDGDIQNSLNKEIASLKSDAKKAPSMRRFQVVDSGAKNCLFIRTTIEEPVKLVHTILKDLEATKKQRTRFLLRLLPIEATCKAYIDDIKEQADLLFEKYFTAEGKSFSIIFNCRNNSGISRDKVIEELAGMVAAKHPANRVDLKQPELAVLVEIIRNVCCLSVLPDYYRFRKYNLLEVSGGTEGKDVQEAGSAEGAATAGEGKTEDPADGDGIVDISIEGTEPLKKTKDGNSVDETT